MARSLAATACQRNLADLPNGMDRVLSAAYQKDRARRRAFHQWELDYHLARAHNDLQVEATGTALDGAAYQYAISQPPSERNHPLWSAAVAMEKDERGRKTRHPLFPRRTTSTALQLAVDHAFTGSYAAKFRPLDPPSSVTFFLLTTVHITDYHWDRHPYFVIHSHHAQTMTHTPPSDDSLLVYLLVVPVACDSD
jgi:hypothetical protein